MMLTNSSESMFMGSFQRSRELELGISDENLRDQEHPGIKRRWLLRVVRTADSRQRIAGLKDQAETKEGKGVLEDDLSEVGFDALVKRIYLIVTLQNVRVKDVLYESEKNLTNASNRDIDG